MINAFVINLDFQIERWVYFKKKVQPYLPFKVKHFSPVPLRQFKSNRMTKRKEMSNVRSFGEIIKLAKQNKWKHVLIFEDDVYFTTTKFKFEDIFKQLPQQFGVCYLGCYIKNTTTTPSNKLFKRYSKNLLQLTSKSFRIWGAHAIIYHESVYDTLINNIFNKDRVVITDRLICDEIVNNKQFDNYIVIDPVLAFQCDKFSGKQKGSMHGNFNFKMMEERTLKIINY